jgi:hypothetical protein
MQLLRDNLTLWTQAEAEVRLGSVCDRVGVFKLLVCV